MTGSVRRLSSVDGWIVHDLDPALGAGVGGTRIGDDITEADLVVLARARTWLHGTFGHRVGGAAAGVRPRLLDDHTSTVARYIEEIRPLVAEGTFRTGPDLGSTAADLAPLADLDHRLAVVPGAPEPVALAAAGPVAAAQAWLGSLEGRTVAVGRIDDPVGAELVRRTAAAGAVVLGVSTRDGAVAHVGGLDVPRLLAGLDAVGPRAVLEVGVDVHDPVDLLRLPADLLFPAGGLGGVRETAAGTVRARAVVPRTLGWSAAGMPQEVVALPDFVCAAGPELFLEAPKGLTAAEELRRVERQVREVVRGAREAGMSVRRWATLTAQATLRTWLPDDQLPPPPTT